MARLKLCIYRGSALHGGSAPSVKLILQEGRFTYHNSRHRLSCPPKDPLTSDRAQNIWGAKKFRHGMCKPSRSRLLYLTDSKGVLPACSDVGGDAIHDDRA